MAKRVRRSISRNKQYETHQLEDKDTGSKYLKFQIRIERKVKSETFEYLATEYGSLKSVALILHDRDLTSDGERIALSHDSRIWEIPDNHIS